MLATKAARCVGCRACVSPAWRLCSARRAVFSLPWMPYLPGIEFTTSARQSKVVECVVPKIKERPRTKIKERIERTKRDQNELPRVKDVDWSPPGGT